MINDTRKTLLLVDDVQVNLDILHQTLEPCGYVILAVTQGEVALQVALKAQPDLILLDVMMPNGIDGYETIRRLKKEPGTRAIPVIFITAKNEPEDIEKFFQEGAVDFIGKPFCQQEVIRRVEIHLKLVSCNGNDPGKKNPTADPGLKQKAAPLPLASSTPLPIKVPNATLAELAEVYLDELRKEMPVIIEALDRKDFSTIIQRAHNYAGSGASHGIKLVTYFGQVLEFTAGQNQTTATAALIDSFRNYLERVEVMRQ